MSIFLHPIHLVNNYHLSNQKHQKDIKDDLFISVFCFMQQNYKHFPTRLVIRGSLFEELRSEFRD